VPRSVLLAVILTSATLARALSAQAPVVPAAAAAAPPGFDRAAAQRDTRALLEALIALDTQNPPGNELLVARHLEALLRAVPGIETILPLPLDMDDELRMHGDNERVPLASLGWGAEYLYRVLLGVARR
jgi:hypothetical protein